MKKIATLLLAAAVMLAALFTLVSCNSNTNNAGNNSPSPAPSEASPAPSQAAPAPVGKIVCGITEYEPMNYRDGSGNWTGFDTEFALLVGEKLNMEVEFQMIEWGNKFAELNSGAISCIWNGFTANAEEDGVPRDTLCDMSYIYMLNQQCVVVKTDRVGEFTSIESLVGKEVAVESGSAGESAAQDLVGASGKTIGASTQINTFLEVKSGAVDCAIVDILLAQKIAGSGDYADLTIASIELDAEVYAIGFKTGDPLRNAVNQAMRELDESGTLAALAEKYGLENNYVLDTSYGS